MARTTKVCHSEQCGGTKQPCELRLLPPADRPAPTVTWVVRCLSCWGDHPPDADFIVRDGRGWAKAHKGANGEIKIPLQETP